MSQLCVDMTDRYMFDEFVRLIFRRLPPVSSVYEIASDAKLHFKIFNLTVTLGLLIVKNLSTNERKKILKNKEMHWEVSQHFLEVGQSRTYKIY